LLITAHFTCVEPVFLCSQQSLAQKYSYYGHASTEMAVMEMVDYHAYAQRTRTSIATIKSKFPRRTQRNVLYRAITGANVSL